MKQRLLHYYDKLVVVLLGFFPFFSFTGCGDEPRCEYGVPNADYILKGIVTDSLTDTPVKNIRVTLKGRYEPDTSDDTVFTDTNGKYNFQFNSFPYDSTAFQLKVEDIDDSTNGGPYNTEEVTACVQQASWDYSEDDGSWYSGKATVTTDIKLNK